MSSDDMARMDTGQLQSAGGEDMSALRSALSSPEDSTRMAELKALLVQEAAAQVS